MKGCLCILDSAIAEMTLPTEVWCAIFEDVVSSNPPVPQIGNLECDPLSRIRHPLVEMNSCDREHLKKFQRNFQKVRSSCTQSAVLVRVCKSWYLMALHLLYRHIELCSTHMNIWGECRGKLLQTFSTTSLGRLVQRLSIFSTKDSALQSMLPNIRTLDCYSPGGALVGKISPAMRLTTLTLSLNEPSLWDAMREISQCTTITSLYITIACGSDDKVSPRTVVLPSITILSIITFQKYPPLYIQFVDTLPLPLLDTYSFPHVESLALMESQEGSVSGTSFIRRHAPLIRYLFLSEDFFAAYLGEPMDFALLRGLHVHKHFKESPGLADKIARTVSLESLEEFSISHTSRHGLEWLPGEPKSVRPDVWCEVDQIFKLLLSLKTSNLKRVYTDFPHALYDPKSNVSSSNCRRVFQEWCREWERRFEARGVSIRRRSPDGLRAFVSMNPAEENFGNSWLYRSD